MASGESQWGTNTGSFLAGLGSALGSIGTVFVGAQATDAAANIATAEAIAKAEQQKQTLHTITLIAGGFGLLILIIVMLVIVTRRKR